MLDTKLKNNGEIGTEKEKAQQKGGQRRGRGLLLCGAFVILVGLLYISGINYRYYQNGDNSSESRFLNDFVIRGELVRYAKNLDRYYIYYGGERFETDKDDTKVYPSDLKEKKDVLMTEYLDKEQGIMNQYEGAFRNTSYEGADEHLPQDTSNPNDASRATFIDANLMAKRTQALEALKDEYSFTDAYLKAEVLKDKMQNYHEIQNYLASNADLRYFIYDLTTNEYHTNIKAIQDGSMTISTYLEDVQFNLVLRLDDAIFSEPFQGVPMSEAFARHNLGGYVFIPTGGNGNTEFSSRVQDILNNSADYANPSYIRCVIFSILLLVLVVVAFIMRKQGVSQALQFLYAGFRKQPLVIKAPVGIFSIILLIGTLPSEKAMIGLFLYRDQGQSLLMLALICFLFAYGALFVPYSWATVRNPKRLKQEPDVRVLQWVWREMKDASYVWKLKDPALILLFCVLICGLLAMAFLVPLVYRWVSHSIWVPPLFSGSLWVMGLIAAIATILLLIRYAKLGYCIHEMTTGKSEQIPTQKGLFTEPLNNLNRLSDGLKHAVNEMTKSERLKTELITNVSHDLKTPLTSIINYVALLKNTPFNDPNATEYIGVLEQKSNRLKLLIEDLFEAVSLNNHAVSLQLEKGDVVHLLGQAMGELNEKIASSQIEFKCTIETPHIYLDVDGKKMWRVFDNLIDNIIKYSAKHSRAYISVSLQGQKAYIVFKNISAYELNVANVSELFERFKRGEASRTTEGSGLGLSIARSIVELHGGEMQIDTDGDLFKVTVILPV